MKKILTTLLFAATLPMVSAQWRKTEMHGNKLRATADDKSYYTLDLSQLQNQLSTAQRMKEGNDGVEISIPTIDGKTERFKVFSFPVVVDELAAKYQLGSYYGISVSDPTVTVRFSIAPNDFQSMMFRNGVSEFIEPANTDKSVYGVHYKTGKSEANGVFCATKEPNEDKNLGRLIQQGNDYVSSPMFTQRSSDKKYRTLRLAMSTTAEYGNFFGGTTAGALAQVNATLTRVNGVFEKELGLHLIMQDYPSLLYYGTVTADPYSTVTSATSPPDAWNSQLMNTLHTAVGDANFDIGHLFGASGGGGNAGCIGCVCSNTLAIGNGTATDTYKGAGITSPATGTKNASTTYPPSGDSFDIDYVAHEMGHQLGAYHTYSWYEGTGVNHEPGSGSTIMGYAGITGSDLDVQAHSDPYFHAASITNIQTNLALSSKTCDTETSITNNPPVITALTAYTIPKSTAFVLTASATDPDGDALTYCWEEVDSSSSAIGSPWGTGAGISNNTSYNHVLGTTTTGATFRSLNPSTDPTRYFPTLATVLGGAVQNLAIWESTSSVARTTHFRVTVRDNAAFTQTAFANQTITVGSAAAFTVSTTSLSAGSNSTVTWVPSGTTASPYNVANVKIDFTSDNGTTWTTLAGSVANSGTASVFVPTELSGKSGHIRVSAIGNVFYAVKAATVGSLAVSDVNNTKSIQIFPNPVKDVLNVSNVTLNSNYEIFSAAGQLVSKGNLGTGKVAVNKLSKGVYFLNVDDKGTVVKTKFVKE